MDTVFLVPDEGKAGSALAQPLVVPIEGFDCGSALCSLSVDGSEACLLAFVFSTPSLGLEVVAGSELVASKLVVSELVLRDSASTPRCDSLSCELDDRDCWVA